MHQSFSCVPVVLVKDPLRVTRLFSMLRLVVSCCHFALEFLNSDSSASHRRAGPVCVNGLDLNVHVTFPSSDPSLVQCALQLFIESG